MNPELWAEIRRLFSIEKLSRSAIAERLGLHRRTIRRALASDSPPSRAPAPPKHAKLDPYRPYLQDRLKQYPELSGAKLLIEIRRLGYTGGYTQLKDHLASLRPKPPQAFLRIETLPGEQAQVDWANCGTIRIGSALRKLSCFVMVLSYSRMLYLEFTLSQCIEDFLAAHLNAFKFFQGLPKKILYDNLKTVVLSRVGREIRFNPRFTDFAGYHLFEPIPCAVAQAHQKGKIESGIKFIRSSFLAGRAITSWWDLNRDAASWRDDVANVRIHGTTRERPVDRWAREHPLLQPLPPRDYDTSVIRPVQATHQAFVLFDANAYSVPWQFARKKGLTLKATHHEVRIFDVERLLATHARSFEKHQYFEKPEHRQGLLASRKAAPAAKSVDAFQALGETAKLYLDGLLHAELHLPFHVQKILGFVDLYGKTEVLQAIDHALKFNAFGAHYIQNIITQQRAKRGLAETPPITIAKKPAWTQLSVEEQDLSLYDDLFATNDPNAQKT